MIYSVCSIEVPPAKHSAALAGIKQAIDADRIAGELRGCWYCEIGRLNRVLAIWAYPSADALAEDRDAILRSDDPFGVTGVALEITLDAYATFPGVEFLPPGAAGPVYEVREYRLKRSGLAPTFAAWAKVLDARRKVSPLATVMYALDGAVPRFMHIWPFTTLNDRMRLRAEAVSQGVWPPPGGLEHIEAMQSEIYLPAAFSPLN
jgi:NIPSNAP protein